MDGTKPIDWKDSYRPDVTRPTTVAEVNAEDAGREMPKETWSGKQSMRLRMVHYANILFKVGHIVRKQC